MRPSRAMTLINTLELSCFASLVKRDKIYLDRSFSVRPSRATTI